MDAPKIRLKWTNFCICQVQGFMILGQILAALTGPKHLAEKLFSI